MNITTITTADDVGALLDEVTHALADVPGQLPRDRQIARVLLSYTMSMHLGPKSRPLLDTLRAYGVSEGEAITIARALQGLTLRLGAWLGRPER